MYGYAYPANCGYNNNSWIWIILIIFIIFFLFWGNNGGYNNGNNCGRNFN